MKVFSQYIKKILFIFFVQFSTCVFAQIEDVVTGIYDASRIYLDGSNLYFSNGGRIDVVDLTDESNPTVSLFQDGFSFAAGMAIYNDEFYVAEFGQSRIVKFSLNEVNPEIVEVSNTGLSPNVIVVHNDFLYYSDNNGGSIYKYNLNGGSNESELLISDYTGVVGLAIKDDFLYFSVSINGGIIYKIDLLDPNASPIALVAGDHPLGIKIYEDILYVADQDFDLIVSFDTNEEPVQNIDILLPFIDNIEDPRDIAIYGSYFYVLEPDRLLRIPLSDLNINLGINEFEGQKTVSIYPNPTTQYIQLTNLETQEEFIIYDLNGREVLKGLYQPNTQINVNNLESGLYYIKFKDKSSLHRFVISK